METERLERPDRYGWETWKAGKYRVRTEGVAFIITYPTARGWRNCPVHSPAGRKVVEAVRKARRGVDGLQGQAL